ncbi:DUF192 domain-containing protein [Salmonella enterica]|nr:DUF192 domain-containing protein [Salmonella enterica]
MKRSLFSIILLATTYQASAEPCMVIFEHGQLITLPAAVTQADQVKGMSGDNSSTGLILTWKTAEPRAVWMKDTSNPLTAAFIGADGVIQSIQDMQPNTDTAHSSLHPTIAIIEMRTEKFKQFRLSKGDKIISSQCFPLKNRP